MRPWLLLVLAAACGNGSAARDAAPGGVRDAGTGGGPVENLVLVDDDFEPGPGRPIDDLILRGFRHGDLGWRAEPGCPVGLEVALADSFETNVYGADGSKFESGVGGWAASPEGDAAVAVVPVEDGLALQLTASATAGSYAMTTHPFTAQASGQVELRVRAPGTARSKWIALDEDDASRIYLYLDDDGQIRTSQGGTKTALGAYQANAWIAVRIEWDAATDRIAISIDGARTADLEPFQPIARHLNRIRLRTAAGQGLSFQVDDVRASGTTGEDVAMRLGAGCAGAALRSFGREESGTLSLEVRAGSSGGARSIALGEDWWDGGGAERFAILFGDDGRVRWRAGGGLAELGDGTPWEPDSWIPIRIHWDGMADTADVWVGDMDHPRARDLPLAVPIGGGIDHVRIAADATTWIDHVRVTAAGVPLLVQASDVHIDGDAEGDAPTDENAVAAAVREWNAAVAPDLVLTTGDVSDWSRPEQFAAYAALMAGSSGRVHSVPGNHDDCDPAVTERCRHLETGGAFAAATLASYRDALGAYRYGFDFGPIHVAAVNGHGKGLELTLSEAELADLDDELARARASGCGGAGCAALVAFQHPMPFEGRIAEPAATELRRIFAENHLLLDLAGHSHQCELVRREGDTVYAVSHPLAKVGSPWPAGYRLIAFDEGSLAQRWRSLADRLPVALITSPSDRAATCEDCGNQGCLSETPPETVDLAVGGDPALSAPTEVRVLVLPAMEERLEAEDAPAFTFAGTWTAYASGNLAGGGGRLADATCDDGDERVEVAFEGRGARLLHSAGPDHGILEVWVDGERQPDIDLHAPRYRAGLARRVTGPLAPGRHVLELRQRGARNPASAGCAALIDAVEIQLDRPLDAELQVDDGGWQPLVYRGNGLYAGTVDPRELETGRHRLRVRVLAGAGTTTGDEIEIETTR